MERAVGCRAWISIEVSPNADPPVCKSRRLSASSSTRQQKKKRNEARKKQKTIDIKEIKMRPNIDHPRLRHQDAGSIHRFIAEGDKVKVTMRFRGREMAHQDRGMIVLDRVRDELVELAKVEQFPKMEGRQMTMVMAPK